MTIKNWAKEKGEIFLSVASECGVVVHHDTHYDALNYEFSKVESSEILRLDFQPTEELTFIVTKYTDHFPAFPRLLSFLHNKIPFFPYFADIKYKHLEELEANRSKSILKSEIKRLVRSTF